MNQLRIININFALTVLLSTVFIWWFSFINEPIGDDYLGYYEGALTYYLDDFEVNLGNKITSVQQVLDLVYFTYLHWSGRIPGYFLDYLGKLFPKYVQAFVTSLIFNCSIIFAMKIAFKTWKNVFANPLYFLLSFLVVYWCKPSVYYTYMWTMVSIYSFGILICLYYYNLTEISISLKKYSKFYICIIGLIAGCSHEVIALCVLSIIISKTIIDCIRRNTYVVIIKRKFVLHFGYLVGYIICFCAPGNFNRKYQTHDIVTTSYFERLSDSFRAHCYVLFHNFNKVIFVSLLLILSLFLFYLLLRRKKRVFYCFLLNNTPFIVGILLSISIWAVAPHVATYGLGLWLFLVLIVIYKIINLLSILLSYKIRFYTFANAVVLSIAMLSFISLNFSEINRYNEISYIRLQCAIYATKHNYDSIKVPLYDTSLSSDRYAIDYLNNQKQFDTDYVIKYYGTRLNLDNTFNLENSNCFK